MLNLLRMDLYRMLRSKSVYICLAILLMMVMVSLGHGFAGGHSPGAGNGG